MICHFGYWLATAVLGTRHIRPGLYSLKDLYVYSCGQHRLVPFILLTGVQLKDTFYSCAVDWQLQDQRRGPRQKVSILTVNWTKTDVHTEPTRTQSDDEIYIT